MGVTHLGPLFSEDVALVSLMFYRESAVKCTWVSESSVALSGLDACVLILCREVSTRAWSDFPNGVGSRAVTQIMESGRLGLRHGLCKWQLSKRTRKLHPQY